MPDRASTKAARACCWEWESHDATYQLILGFYEALREPGVSKAEALRRAQAKLIESPVYSHPFYWSPFLLIGSWL